MILCIKINGSSIKCKNTLTIIQSSDYLGQTRITNLPTELIVYISMYVIQWVSLSTS